MKSLNRLFQALTLLGAVLSGVFYFLHLATQRTEGPDPAELQQQLSLERSKATQLGEKLSQTETADEELRQSLNEAKSEKLALTAQLNQLQRENARFVDERSTRQASEERLQNENARLVRELAETQANSVPKEQIADYEAKIERLERSLLDLQQTTADPAAQLAATALIAPENPSLRGRVLTVGKGASFVVLDIGYNDGVRLQNELLIQHADTPIAKIQVTEVKENLSIARVLPESLVKTPQTGDSVSSFN